MGNVRKIVSRGRLGAEAGVVVSANESGDLVEIVADLADGLAKSDAALVICDAAPDADGEALLRLCAECAKPCEVCELDGVPDNLVWMPLLETGRQIDSLAHEAHKDELTLFVCGTHEADAPGIARKAKAVFDSGHYCVKAWEEWRRWNDPRFEGFVGPRQAELRTATVSSSDASEKTGPCHGKCLVSGLSRLVIRMFGRLRYAGCFFRPPVRTAAPTDVPAKVDWDMEGFDGFPYHRGDDEG